jgi:hypothetical protein
MITLRIDDRQWRRDLKNFKSKSESGFQTAITKATNILVMQAKMRVKAFTMNSKVKSGFLMNNIDPLYSDKKLTGTVISRMNYSQAFEEGTRPHTIRTMNKKVLAGPYRGRPTGWEVSAKSKEMGYATYGKEVHHPGTHAHPFMFPAWKHACQMLEIYIKQALT